MTPELLVPTDLHQADSRRRIWEAAIAIPACKWRVFYSEQQKPMPVRNINTGFAEIADAFSKAGPVVGGWRRPRSPYILDLVSYNRGFELFEMCHVLAHVQLLLYPNAGKISELVQLWLAKTAVALRYDLPLFEGFENASTFKELGIRVITAYNPRQPLFKLPVSGEGSLVPYQELGCIFVGIGTESIPNGFRTGTGRWTAATRWCCGCTQACIAGWELVDVITHMPVLTHKGCYSIHPLDLQSPQSFVELIRGTTAGIKTLELLDSDIYKQWLSVTPPLPAPNCLLFKTDEASGLVRPMKKRPEGKLNPRIKDHLAWISFDNATTAITDLVEKGTIFYEGSVRVKTKTSASISRKQRLAGYRKLKAAINKSRNLMLKVPKLLAEGWLKEARNARDEAQALSKACEEKIGKAEAYLDTEAKT